MAIYGRILRTPGVALLIAATTLTRLPFAINGLAVILFLRETTGSYATAGLVAGSLALGAGIGAPFAARLVDRRGAVWLLPLAVGHAGAILALWALGELDVPAAALVACGLVAGASFPPSGAVLRSRWPELLAGEPELIRGAYAFDSVTIEMSFVSGPLLTAGLVALSGPQAALGLSAALVIAGTLLFLSRLPDRRRALPAGDGTSGLGPLRSPAIRADRADHDPGRLLHRRGRGHAPRVQRGRGRRGAGRCAARALVGCQRGRRARLRRAADPARAAGDLPGDQPALPARLPAARSPRRRRSRWGSWCCSRARRSRR